MLYMDRSYLERLIVALSVWPGWILRFVNVLRTEELAGRGRMVQVESGCLEGT